MPWNWPAIAARSINFEVCRWGWGLWSHHEFSQGWRRHCAAVALLSGWYSNMRRRKSENPEASANRKWYFSTSTSWRLQNLSGPTWRRLPVWRTKSYTRISTNTNYEMIYRREINKDDSTIQGKTGFTSATEVLCRVFTRQGNSWWYITEQLHDLGYMVWSGVRKQAWITQTYSTYYYKPDQQLQCNLIYTCQYLSCFCHWQHTTKCTFLQGNKLASFGFKQGVSSD